MSYSPVPPSSDPGFPGYQPFPGRVRSPSETAAKSGAIDVFSILRQRLSDRTQSLDSMLHAVTDAARVLTGASGIALALRTQGVVVCRARSGEIAPAIGARLEVSSGISGECFRTSTALRCGDTETDPLVDAAVCRALGIRSIAAVPLRGPEGPVGILEAFSNLPHAFSAEQGGVLQRLAEIVEASYQRELGEKAALTVPPLSVAAAAVRQELTTRPSLSGPPLPAELSGDAPRRNGRRYWIVGVVALLLMMSGVAWVSWQAPEADLASTAPVVQPQTTAEQTSSPGALTVLPWKPAAGHVRVRSDGMSSDGRSSKRVLQSAAEVDREAPEVTVRIIGGDSSPVPAAASRVSRAPEDLPPVVTAAADGANLGALTTSSAAMPSLDIPISKGITPAVLLRKVDPVYPANALARHVEGSVVLRANITEDGATRDLKVISGPVLLVQAARDAVSQWRYRPTLLNGNPVATERQITVVFKAP